MRAFRAHVLLLAAIAGLTHGAAPAAARVGAEHPAALVGSYDGGQMEIAAGLELRADGRFRYALSYGALDEEARGRWSVEDGRLLLTSDPVVPPRFVLVESVARPGGSLAMSLDVPQGMSRQYFHARITLADGRVIDRQLHDDGDEWPIAPGARAASIRLTLPVFDVASTPVSLAGGTGHRLRFRFDANDLGKVAFARTPLRIEGGVLVLERYDRAIAFRRIAAR